MKMSVKIYLCVEKRKGNFQGVSPAWSLVSIDTVGGGGAGGGGGGVPPSPPPPLPPLYTR